MSPGPRHRPRRNRPESGTRSLSVDLCTVQPGRRMRLHHPAEMPRSALHRSAPPSETLGYPLNLPNPPNVPPDEVLPISAPPPEPGQPAAVNLHTSIVMTRRWSMDDDFSVSSASISAEKQPRSSSEENFPTADR